MPFLDEVLKAEAGQSFDWGGVTTGGDSREETGSLLKLAEISDANSQKGLRKNGHGKKRKHSLLCC